MLANNIDNLQGSTTTFVSWKYQHQNTNGVTTMDPSWNRESKARKEKVWVEDQLMWNKNGAY